MGNHAAVCSRQAGKNNVTYRHLRVDTIHGHRRDRVVICISHGSISLRDWIRSEGRSHVLSLVNRVEVRSLFKHVFERATKRIGSSRLVGSRSAGRKNQLRWEW